MQKQTQTSAFAGKVQTTRPLYVPLVTAYSVGLYLSKVVWPSGLVADYPFPQPLSLVNPAVLLYVAGAVLVLAAVIASARRTRAFVAGGLFVLVALSPTLGIVRYTSSIAANRSMYLAIVGLLLPAAWGMDCLWRSRTSRLKSVYVRAGAMAVVAVFAVSAAAATRKYESHWQNTMGLLRYYVSQTPNEWKLHTRIANEWIVRGDYPAAISEFQEAVRLSPDWTENYLNLGRAFLTVGDHASAKGALEQALERTPNDWQAHMLMGMAVERGGELDRAVHEYGTAAQLAPTKATPHYYIANIQVQQGLLDQATAEYEECLRLEPQFWKARRALTELASKRR